MNIYFLNSTNKWFERVNGAFRGRKLASVRTSIAGLNAAPSRDLYEIKFIGDGCEAVVPVSAAEATNNNCDRDHFFSISISLLAQLRTLRD